MYEEMRFAAAEIARLVREEGLRYRDCVILCRDLDRYRNAKTVLEEYDLPYFCGEKQNILFAPLPFFLLTALEAASGSLKTAAILRLARSAASGLSPQQAGTLENYSFIWNISGEDWLRPIEPLAALRQSLKNAAGPDFAAAVYRYAEAAGALQNLTQNSPLPQREAVDRQWNSLVDVLDLMTDFYPERALNAREWSELFRLALSRIWARCQIPWIMSSWRKATGCGCKAPGPSLSLASMRAFSRPMGPRQGFFPPGSGRS